MAVFRIEKNKDYTVMSNYHLRDSSLSLKAKGLLSQMLSLPEGWDYTLSGLAEINKESKDAIRSAVNELEQSGYVIRRQTADEKGKFAANEYIIREQPVSADPLLDFPTTENPSSENPTQLNIDISSKDISKKENKKKKKAAPKPEPLTDDELRPIVVANITQIADPSWSADIKNELFRWVMALYDPARAVKKAHPVRSKLSVEGTFRKLALSGKDPSVMIGMLCTAIEAGWQGVQVPNSKKSHPVSDKPKQEERQYKCV